MYEKANIDIKNEIDISFSFTHGGLMHNERNREMTGGENGSGNGFDEKIIKDNLMFVLEDYLPGFCKQYSNEIQTMLHSDSSLEFINHLAITDLSKQEACIEAFKETEYTPAAKYSGVGNHSYQFYKQVQTRINLDLSHIHKAKEDISSEITIAKRYLQLKNGQDTSNPEK